jgi:hypothetical protein
MIDRATEMRGCGFIGVNNRYLLWKYGVTYREHICGNCGYYEAGEYSHGICTNEQITPHPKGVIIDGEKTYIDSKECFSGAHACGKFVKKEEPKKNCYHCLYHESHRCRNQNSCPEGMKYIKYTGSSVKQCLCATTEVYQDGYIHCPILESIGCKECMEKFGDGSDYEYDESQNYEREPDWKEFKKQDDTKKEHCLNCGKCLDKPYYVGPKRLKLTYCDYNCYYEKFREEVKEMPKQTYYTKCGRQFKKNSTATVTGCEIDLREDSTISEVYQILKKEAREALAECVDCPFKVSVKEGWPPVHKKWECRAGSEPPNHTTEWDGSLEDKNTLSIHSLDNQLMEEIREYCKNHPDLGADYNVDHKADCRRTLSISCSSNKKGIAAKKELIEKFFPEIDMVPDSRFEEEEIETPECNENDAVSIGDFVDTDQVCRVCGCTWNTPCEGGCYWVEDDLCSKCAEIAEDSKEEKGDTVNMEALTEVRPLKLIEAEINFYKTQTASGIFEIGKRLIEAKEQIPHGEWEKWLEEKVDFSQNTAGQFMRVAREFSNSEPVQNLGTRKIFALLAVPEESRKQFIDEKKLEDMTSRQVEAAVREYKKEIAQKQQALEKANKYADEHMMRARDAEKKVSDKENALKSLQTDLNYATQQLTQAKTNGSFVKVRELGLKIAEYQEEIEGYQKQIGQLNKQLHDKPIEVSATSKTVEKEVIPDSIRYAISQNISNLIHSCFSVTETEASIFIESVISDNYIEIGSNIQNAIDALEKIQIKILVKFQKNIPEPDGHCGDCDLADMDGVTEEEIDEGKTLCTVTGEIVDFDHSCNKYEKHWRQV